MCSAGKADLVRSLGADDAIDDATEDFSDGSRHLVLDIAGNTSLRRLRRALEPTGSLVIAGESKGIRAGGRARCHPIAPRPGRVGSWRIRTREARPVRRIDRHSP